MFRETTLIIQEEKGYSPCGSGDGDA
jgi:hypothetical protein